MKNVSIRENVFKIKIDEKIDEIKNENLIRIFNIICAIKNLEIKKGNEYDKAWIKIKYIRNTPISEYLNIFKLVRTPSLYDFIKYFKTIKEKYNRQNNETKLDIDDYLEQEEDVSQEILIIMVFNIETKIEEIEKEEKMLLNLLKINNINEEIFEIIKK